MSGMIGVHRLLGTWKEKIDLFLAVSEFSRRKLVAGGLPAGKVRVKPNFCHPDPGTKSGGGSYVLYVGRLSIGKGIPTLLKAWSRLPDIPLVIVGDGPLENRVLEAAKESGGSISFRGRRAREEIFSLMKGAKFLVFPSELYEGLPMTILEAFACGLPVVACRHGAMEEVVTNRGTGILVTPGEPDELSEAVRWWWDHASEARELGRRARLEYETKYTAEANYKLIESLYARVLRGDGRN